MQNRLADDGLPRDTSPVLGRELVDSERSSAERVAEEIERRGSSARHPRQGDYDASVNGLLDFEAKCWSNEEQRSIPPNVFTQSSSVAMPHVQPETKKVKRTFAGERRKWKNGAKQVWRTLTLASWSEKRKSPLSLDPRAPSHPRDAAT